MSHVDEGALHAYLDGALDEYPSAEAERIRTHLEACAECAERLEAERRVRSDAHALLGLAAPEVEVPSFEELRAYVQRTRRQRKGISRLQRLGWAASIMVALGAGWMLRDGQLQSRALDIGRQGAPLPAAEPATDPAARSPGVAEAEDPGVAPVNGQATDDPAADFADAAEYETLQVRSAAREAPESDLADAAGAGERAEETPLRIQEREAALRQVERNREARAWLPTDTVGVSGVALEVLGDHVALQERYRGDDTTDVTADAGEEAARTAPPAPAPEAGREPVAPAGTVRAGGASTADASAVRPVMSALDMTRAEAFDEVGKALPGDSVPADPLLAVPGHEVLDVVNLGDGTTPWGVRVRQRLGDGRTFEVFHLEAGIDPSILPDEGEEAGEVRAETGQGWVLIRGPLSERELAELLGSLFPGES